MQPQTHRRRPYGKRHLEGTSQSPSRKGPISGPRPNHTIDVPNVNDDDDLLDSSKNGKNDDSNFFLLKSNKGLGGKNSNHRKRSSFQKYHGQHNGSITGGRGYGCCCCSSDPNSWYEYTGCNFLVPALSIWWIILMVFWFPEVKDNALDYYYLQYPEQQPVSLIPGTVLPLIPNVWMYDIDPAKKGDDENTDNNDSDEESHRKRAVRNHLKQHKQPHYYMLPQDYYDQQPPSDGTTTSGDDTLITSNTALEAPKIRGVLIVLHDCHQTGLHFFQLPESRIVAAHAMQKGLAIFSPTASSASQLSVTNTNHTIRSSTQPGVKANPTRGAGGGGDQGSGNQEKNCWWAELDGDELLGPLLYEWSKELKLDSLPRMAMGITNGANLLITSSLYKTLRLQSMALYASHHPKGFDPDDLERDIVPATAFIVFPESYKATESARQHHNTLLKHAEQVQKDSGGEQITGEDKIKKKTKEEEEDQDEESGDKKESAISHFNNGISQKSYIFQVHPHAWTPSLCQGRLPEYHTRCRSFFRRIQKFQKNKLRKQEEKQMKQDPQQRAKRNRLGGGYAKMKQRTQLLSSTGEILQSSKNPQWIPVMDSVGLDDWTTHTMAFTLASGVGRTAAARRRQRTTRQKKNKSQLLQFPTTATPEGRSWLWASMLQEIEVAFGVQEMTSEYSPQVLDFLLHHSGLSKHS